MSDTLFTESDLAAVRGLIKHWNEWGAPEYGKVRTTLRYATSEIGETHCERAIMLNTLLAEREAQAVQRERERNQYASTGLLHEDEQGKIGGHIVVGCSGGADYVGDFETGYPRQIMLSPVEGEGQATYYHESVVQREREAAKGLVEALEGAKLRLKGAGMLGGIYDEVN
jgi:hypothetical protein